MADLRNEVKELKEIIEASASQDGIQRALPKNQAKAKVNQYKDDAGVLANQAKDQASQWLETGKDYASDWVETGRDYASDLHQSASHMSNSVQSYWDKHSSHLYAIAIALLGIKLIRNLKKLGK